MALNYYVKDLDLGDFADGIVNPVIQVWNENETYNVLLWVDRNGHNAALFVPDGVNMVFEDVGDYSAALDYIVEYLTDKYHKTFVNYAYEYDYTDFVIEGYL